MMDFCVRRTFIDEIVAHHGSRTQRSHSAPLSSICSLFPKPQDDYDQYMNELRKQATSFEWWQHGGREATSRNACADSCTPSRHAMLKDQLQIPNVVDATTVPLTSMAESIRNEGSSSNTGKQFVYPDQGYCQDVGPHNTQLAKHAAFQYNIGAPQSFSSDFLEHVPVPEMCGRASNSECESDIPADWGHPELCTRPCIYFPSGNCAHGLLCRFCHGFHDKPPHFDKRGRSVMKALTPEQRASLIAPIILRKAVELNLHQQVLELLEELAFTSPSQLEKIREDRLAAIKSTLEKMNMRQLLSIILSGGDTSQDLRGDVIRKHIQRMRICMKPLLQ